MLGLAEFADLFGTTPAELPAACRALIAAGNFRYEVLQGDARDRQLLDVLKRIDAGSFSTAGPNGKARWDKGWGENLAGFRDSGSDLSALVPKYIRPHQAVRLHQQYVMPEAADFELKWYEIFQHYMFSTYFAEAPVIYEFGCGSGINLATLARMYPEKRYHGLDWAAPSREIVNELGTAYGWNMSGHLFDFFHPDRSLTLEPNALVFTLGALEQTGSDNGAFLDYLLEQAPALVVNIEPMLEWYDEDNLVDYAAIRFHTVRNYWRGFPGRLAQLAREGRVEILKQKRSYFGSLFVEGYSQLIWRPVPR